MWSPDCVYMYMLYVRLQKKAMYNITANHPETPQRISSGSTCLQDIQRLKSACGNFKSAHHHAQTHLPTGTQGSLKWRAVLKMIRWCG